MEQIAVGFNLRIWILPTSRMKEASGEGGKCVCTEVVQRWTIGSKLGEEGSKGLRDG